MVNVRKETLDDKIRFKVADINTICPHRKYNREDYTDVEIDYLPGTYEIIEERLREYIEKKIEGRELVMEIIPLKILGHLIEDTATRKPPNRYASPRETQITSTSRGKKKWSMTVKIRFEREITG